MTQAHDATGDDIPPGWEGLLSPGERILWQGPAGGGIVWRDLASFLTIFGLFFAGFAVFFMTFALGIMSGDSDIPLSFKAPFVMVPTLFILVGLYMAVGRLFWDAYLRSTTHYTLTSEAAFIASAPFGRRKLDRYPLTGMRTLRLDDGAPGSVWFAEKISHHRSENGGTSTSVTPIGFRRIADHRAVYRQLLEARRAKGVE